MKWIEALLEPREQIDTQRQIFTNAGLRALIVPLLLEQLLGMLIGLADTLMVSYAGEAAVSGVTLVNMVNMLFLYLFTSLASGGAVVISQYLGRKDREQGDMAASQTALTATLLSALFMVVMLLFNRQILGLLFGGTDASVMKASEEYLRITAYSYPFIALYSVGAALYRSMGKTNVTMRISIGMNLANVIGNAIGIFVLHAGVAGVAWPSTLSRALGAAAIIALCFRKESTLRLRWRMICAWSGEMQRRILRIAVPNSIESGLFQLSKVALSSIIALFGTSQIAANGVAQSFWSFAALIGVAMGPAYITVVGRCMGAGDTGAAEYYMKKLTRLTLAAAIAWNIVTMAIAPLLLRLYDLSDETRNLVWILIVIHNCACAILSPLAGPFSSGLRAAGDVKYSMFSSLFATVVCRVALAFLFGLQLNMGVIGVALAMVSDWVIRVVLMGSRFRSGKWKQYKVI